MTASGALEAAPSSTTDAARATSYAVPGRRLARFAVLAGSALALAACSTTGPLPEDTAQEPNTVSRLVPGNDYDAQIRDPGDAVVDAAVVGGGDYPLALSLDVATPEKADLWQRARMRFVMEVEDDRPRLDREIEWFQRNQEYVDRVAERARLYLHHVVSEVERRNLPGELALLPVVESAYQPFAYSPARASGIWQFIPSTARLYGLRYSWWYDGRRDVVESTRAALDYLEQLYAEFSGDWLLALAAYNSGAGNVRKAIRRNVRAGKPTDFWSLRLPRETRSYVPRLLAIRAIVARPDQYGLALKPIPDTPYFAETRLDGQIDLALAAKMAKVSLDELYLLNPGFSRWATDPAGPHRLLLPVNAIPGFEQRLAELPANQRVRWHRHVIESGDTLGTIARKYRTSVSALQQANNLRGTTIRKGRSLIVPVASQSLADYRLSADMRRSMRRRIPGSGNKIIYRVRRGDSLWVISRRFEVSVNKLARWNGLAKSSVLRPGQKLVIWRGKSRAQPAATKVAIATVKSARAPLAEPPEAANGASGDPGSI
ncbi:MAG: LysM peptidoglycan-binding domain-containing protein [Gammaproteobacteria bacterium]|nr:MAG: LysM peptidoglycan-binding domain-containing protein [Gammaproteobacteria bacterium]